MIMAENSGFSLVEVLIAMAIFAIGILGVATMQISSTNGNTTARMSSEASEFAQSQIDQLLAETTYTNVVDGNAVTADGYTVQWTVVNESDIDLDGNNDTKEVRVIVSDPRGQLRADLTFFKYANI